MPKSISPIIGRRAEMSELRAALNRTSAGSGGCLVVEGPAGIGKSRLLNAAAAEAAELGMAVVVGRATELDQVAPLTTLRRFIQLNGLPCLTEADGTPQYHPLLLVDLVHETLAVRARAGPMLVVLDDAHRADELTARALRVLVPALSGLPVFWLLASGPSASRKPAQVSIDWLLRNAARPQGQVLPPGPDPGRDPHRSRPGVQPAHGRGDHGRLSLGR
jgi:hypothetical protein